MRGDIWKDTENATLGHGDDVIDVADVRPAAQLRIVDTAIDIEQLRIGAWAD